VLLSLSLSFLAESPLKISYIRKEGIQSYKCTKTLNFVGTILTMAQVHNNIRTRWFKKASQK
jgi:hypothetical protein